MTKPLVYCAGPYSHPDPVANTRAAMAVWDTLWDSGLVVPVCPHWSMFQHLSRPRPYEEWMDYDFHLVDRCDALLRMAGASKGADREVVRATEREIPVFSSVSHLLAWAENWCKERNRSDR